MAKPLHPRIQFWKLRIFPLFVSVLILFIIGVCLSVGLPRWLEGYIKADLTASGLKSANFSIESFNPWFTRIADIDLVGSSLNFTAESVMVQYSPWIFLRRQTGMGSLDSNASALEPAGLVKIFDKVTKHFRAESFLQLHILSMPYLSINMHNGHLEIIGGVYPVLWPIEAYMRRNDKGSELTLLAGAGSGELSLRAIFSDPESEDTVQFILTAPNQKVWMDILRRHIFRDRFEELNILEGSLGIEGEIVIGNDGFGDWVILSEIDDLKGDYENTRFVFSRIVAGFKGNGDNLERGRISGLSQSFLRAQTEIHPFEFLVNYGKDGIIVIGASDLSLRLLDRSEIIIKNIVSEIDFKKPRTFSLIRFEAEILGGRFWLEPFAVDSQLQDDWINLVFENINADQAVSLMPELSGAVVNLLQGRISLRFRESGLEFDQTALARQANWDTTPLSELLQALGLKAVQGIQSK